MRAVAKTLMIIFAVVEVGLGLKRTVTIADRDGNICRVENIMEGAGKHGVDA